MTGKKRENKKTFNEILSLVKDPNIKQLILEAYNLGFHEGMEQAEHITGQDIDLF